ncbi:MAG: hypothetical protein WCM76_10150 [Bacteroidota bacterium]
MAVKICYHEDIKVVETVYVGPFPKDELFNSVTQTLEFALEKNTLLLLGDCKGLSDNGSLVDIYSLAEYYLTIFESHKFKEAIILPENKEAAKNLKFYETTCINRGFDVKVFSDRESAVSWLISEN